MQIDITGMSIEELMNIDVTTVSKRPERLAGASSAIFVLTGEEIRRSGARSIPEALRLVPGVHVARIDMNKWSVTIRGFGGRTASKLLVLIDGRSVYNQLFSGVFWEARDVAFNDVERIEVVRGPGGTLWGANAVNGVINIITKHAKATQGGIFSGGGGSEERAFGMARYGAQLGENTWGRTFAKYDLRDDGYPSSIAEDDYQMGRGGFRIDSNPNERDAFSFQGGGFDGEAGERLGPGNMTGSDSADVGLRGAHLLSSWNRALEGKDAISLQAYWDFYEFENPSLREHRHTGDIEFQHTLALQDIHTVVWGLRHRITGDDIDNGPIIGIRESERVDNVSSAFLQDEIALIPEKLNFILGSKVEYNDYTGFEYQPNARISYLVTEEQTVWAAVSRAVRTPSRLEDDILVPGLLEGSRDFDSEELIAYELGYRIQPLPTVSIDAAVFYNDYDRLVTVDRGVVGNSMEGYSNGVEISARWQLIENVRLDLTYSYLQLDVDLKNDSDDFGREAFTGGADAHNLATARVFWEPAHDWQLDATLRYSDELTALDVDDYLVADVRVAWLVREDVQIAVVGQNLFDSHHFEQPGITATQVEPGVYGELTLRF